MKSTTWQWYALALQPAPYAKLWERFTCRDGGTGRRSGLKIRRPSGLGGSTPPPGTMISKKLSESVKIVLAPRTVQVCEKCAGLSNRVTKAMWQRTEPLELRRSYD